MRRNKKFYVYMMLFLVLIAQLAFSGKGFIGTDVAASVRTSASGAVDMQADSTVDLYVSDDLSEGRYPVSDPGIWKADERRIQYSGG